MKSDEKDAENVIKKGKPNHRTQKLTRAENNL